jgi:hypothetical protein
VRLTLALHDNYIRFIVGEALFAARSWYSNPSQGRDYDTAGTGIDAKKLPSRVWSSQRQKK